MIQTLRNLSPRSELLLLTAVAGLMLGFFLPFHGVWEPWEADRAKVVEAMHKSGKWLRVQMPEAGGRAKDGSAVGIKSLDGKTNHSVVLSAEGGPLVEALRGQRVGHTAKLAGGETWKITSVNRVVPDLPFGWWPSAGLTRVAGLTASALRLPGFLLSLLVVLLAFGVGRRFYGRLAAWLGALALLSMPLFAYSARHSISEVTGASLLAIATLAFLRGLADPEASERWVLGAWAATAGAGLCMGIPGLAAPLLAAAAVVLSRSAEERPAALKRALPVLAVAPALVVVGLGWWRASVYSGGDLNALLLYTDWLGGTADAAKRPTFEGYVHQIGFGLFPMGALLPLAFAELLTSDARDDETKGAHLLGPGLAAGFAAAFLAPALAAPFSHFAVFSGAALVAVAIGAYLSRALRDPPRPLLVVVTVIIWALLDSNLKHETQLLADAVVGARVDAFPPKLPGWWGARVLSFAVLGVLILYQGGVRHHLEAWAERILYPKEGRPKVDLLTAVIALALPGALYRARPGILVDLLAWGGWIRLKSWARELIVFAALWLIAYLCVWTVWAIRARQVEGKDATGIMDRIAKDGGGAPIVRLVGKIQGWLGLNGVGAGALLALAACWGLFLNGWVAHALTENFSQKDILNQYEALKQGDEAIFQYKVDARSSTFYTRDLEALTSTEFAKRAKADARFFAIVPRKQLARINSEFRKATSRTLPVLDDRSYRFLLVSNTLKSGETDRSPIKSALLDKLPPGANKVKINFEDKVHLVGWKLDPPQPSPGSPLAMTFFWKVKKKMGGKYKVFVHIDAAGQRIHGDHDPVEGLYPSTDWAPGDLIADTHHVKVKRTISRARFTFYAGLYSGSKRLKIKSGPKDNENRGRLGYVKVK